MENVASTSESTQICFQKDININLDGTENIKELMVTQKDKIVELEQNITKNENSFTNMTNLKKNLNESINKIFADIENRTNFTNASEEYKTNIITTAQTIDTFILDLDNAISSAEAIFNEYIDCISNENEQIYNSKIQCWEQKEKELATELEKTKQTHIEDNNTKEAIAKENIALKLELEHLNIEVESYEQKLKDVLGFEEKINNQKRVINMLNDKCKWYDNETLVLAKSYDSIISQRIESEENISKNIENCKIKINELEKESQHAVEKLKHLETKEENSNTELLKLKGSIRNSEIDFIHLINKSQELNKLTLSAQESFDEEMHSYQEELSRIEDLITCNQEIGSKLSERIETREIEMKQIDSDITTLKDMVEEEDVCRQIELKQNHIQELNTVFQKTQDTYLKERVLRAEITETEKGNEKMVNNINNLEKVLQGIKDKTFQLEKDKNCKQNILKDLEKQIPCTSQIPPKKLSRWDSDSSTDGEEIWLSDLIK